VTEPDPPAADPDGAVPGSDADGVDLESDADGAGRAGPAGPGGAPVADLVAVADWAKRAAPEVLAVLRGERPEVTARVVEAGAAVAAAARSIVEAVVRPPAAEPDPAPDPEPPAQRRVQQIDVE
jgi:hypothetical protein